MTAQTTGSTPASHTVAAEPRPHTIKLAATKASADKFPGPIFVKIGSIIYQFLAAACRSVDHSGTRYMAPTRKRKILDEVPAPIEDLVENFDEAWYRRQNRDLTFKSEGGFWDSGLQHYLAHGKDEGRLPAPPALDELPRMYNEHNGPGFLSPHDLTTTEIHPRKIALIGSCMMESWEFHISNPSNCLADLIVVNNAGSLPDIGISKFPSYDFQIIQIPLRSIMTDSIFLSISNEDDYYQKCFDDSCDRLKFHLESRMEWNLSHGLLTFVSNFMIPQNNPNGALLPRYTLENPEYFVSRLNEYLESAVRKYKNAYMLDVDRISASLGRRYVQDDTLAHFSHGALMGVSLEITSRIETLAPTSQHYDIRWPDSFREALWAEIIKMFRTVQQTDSVKLVVVDLDDTLWNGVSGDLSDISPIMVEGWPLGLAEALLFLKKKGILLAIISKNDEARIRDIWKKVFGNKFSLENFSAIKINWNPKTENMNELLSDVNLLPRNVVFVDDNPVERAAMAAVFPEMRILGRYPYYLRRTLLWSSETQVPYITKESGRRTEMMKAQIARERTRKTMSREEFLAQAAPRVIANLINDPADSRFPRVFELINKTNQFNTTGKRWTLAEIAEFIASGGVIFSFDVVDNYTDYGLVGAVLTKGTAIEQWVMSCRVLGYQIEVAVMALVAGVLRQFSGEPITGRLIHTDVNFPCRDLFQNSGFTKESDYWVLLPSTEMSPPKHVYVVA